MLYQLQNANRELPVGCRRRRFRGTGRRTISCCRSRLSSRCAVRSACCAASRRRSCAATGRKLLYCISASTRICFAALKFQLTKIIPSRTHSVNLPGVTHHGYLSMPSHLWRVSLSVQSYQLRFPFLRSSARTVALSAFFWRFSTILSTLLFLVSPG